MRNVLTPAPARADFLDWYHANRRRSAMLFDLVDAETYFSRPIPLRHPINFYEGHLPAFSFITLVRNTLHHPSIDARLEKLFQRGIDPADEKAAAAQSISAWPSRDEVRAFGHACDAAVLAALSESHTWAPGSREIEAAYCILEHEQMHHETLLYILHQVPFDHKQKPANGALPPDGDRPAGATARIEAGEATLGARRSGVAFGWDNEFEETRVHVPAFSIDADSVTNADYLEFVEAGGPPPPFWFETEGKWRVRGMFESALLRRSWPVFATHDQAAAYANWKGKRLPTESEYHRAAFSAPDGSERSHPWGEAMPDASRGNFDFERWDPEAAGSRPAGASAWGVRDLVGNGWEWTDTPFRPLPGFAPMATYPQYSADFFDEQHYVVKGASPVTARDLIRRSLRNWYRPNYPYIYAKFRCVS